MSSLILGIDFGGTKNAVALIADGMTEWLDYRRQISLPTATAKSDLETVLNLSQQLLASRSGKLLAVGVSFGGPVDFAAGRARQSYHVPGWENYPLQKRLQKEFNVPVIIDNDANAGAFGEWKYGAGENCQSMFYVTVSTGIGGGWIIDGKPYRGTNNLAGEIGHLLIDPNGPRCACGKRGCLEVFSSGPAISRQVITLLNQEPHAGTILQHLWHDNPEQITAETISKAANEGDPLAQAVLIEAAHYLGMGIGQVLTLMNPEKIILGGGVTKAGKIYWEKVRRSAREYAFPGTTIDIMPAKLQDAAPLWGAIALAKQLLSEKNT